MLFYLFLLLSIGGSNSQFAEIASLATSFLGSGLGGLGGLAGSAGTAAAGAGSAAGALGQIGQLYQLAQGALQLTGTGVGVLNQATEGNWFPAALEAAAKNQEQLKKGGGGLGPLPGAGGGLGGLGGLPGLVPLGPLGPRPGGGGGAGVGPEFGTSFPAPDIDDYKDDLDILTSTTATTTKDPFEEIEDKDLEKPGPITAAPTTAAPTTTTETVTLFPDEEELDTLAPTPPPKKQIRIELPKEDNEEEDYFDQVKKENNAEVSITNQEKKDADELLLGPVPRKTFSSVDSKPVTAEGKDKQVPNLSKFVETLKQRSSLSEEEIMELIGQVSSNANSEAPPKIDFASGVQNIGYKKADNRKRIIEASRQIDASWRGQPVQSHRLSTVTLRPTLAPTPAPFAHTTTEVSEEVLNNRLQREITAAGGDKDLSKLGDKPASKKPVPVPPAPPLATTPATYVNPVAVPQTRTTQAPRAVTQPRYIQTAPQPVHQPVQQPPIQQQAPQQLYTQQQVYPNAQQTQQLYHPNPQQVALLQQQQQYYPYQQYQQNPWAQYHQYYYQQYPHLQQQYHTQQVLVGSPPGQPQQQPQQQQIYQPRPVAPTAPQVYQQPHHPQYRQQPVATQRSPLYYQRPAVQPFQQKFVQPQRPAVAPQPAPAAANVPRVQLNVPAGQTQVASPARHVMAGETAPYQNVQTVQNVNGASSNVYVNRTGKAEDFFTTTTNNNIRARRNRAKGARIVRQQLFQQPTPAPYRRYYARTAQTQQLTTMSPTLQLPEGIQAEGQLLINRSPETSSHNYSQYSPPYYTYSTPSFYYNSPYFYVYPG